MRHSMMIFAVLAAVGWTSSAQAQGTQGTQGPGPVVGTDSQAASAIELYKDPLVAAYLSATLPGLGQFYSDQKKRGIFFFTAIVGSFGAAYAFYEPAILTLSDYDDVANGGNGDGILETTEVQNWEDREFEEDAFDRLSDGRKAGLIISAVAGAGLYIWNVLDAPKTARERNQQVQQSRVGFDLQAGADRASLALQLRF